MKSWSGWISLILGIVLFSLATGCSKQNGPEVGYVTGVVRLDGKPLEGAAVEFIPLDHPNLRPSASQTDSSGRYELFYSAARKGAALGRHDVTIRKVDPTENPGPKGRTLQTPAKYGKPGELKATVEKGTQSINFELSS